ncbi:MAG TPA: hypothetical protein VHL78_00330, partial [Actinomycetota bacterium]|nr:hypothetical protein [Actinomycetota bacterium]
MRRRVALAGIMTVALLMIQAPLIADETQEQSPDTSEQQVVEPSPAPTGDPSVDEAGEVVDGDAGKATAHEPTAAPGTSSFRRPISSSTAALEPAAMSAPDPDTPGPPSGSGVQPLLLLGNVNCPSTFHELRLEPPQSGTFSNGMLSVTVTKYGTALGEVFDWSSNLELDRVIVKGGSNANQFSYAQEATSDTLLHAPVNPSNGSFYGLSHISFCYDSGMTIVKDDASDSGTSFDFTGPLGGFALSDDGTPGAGSRSFADLLAGRYRVEEVVPADWDLTAVLCTSLRGTSTIVTEAVGATLQRAAGDNVTCTFRNKPEPRGSITIEKDAVPDSGQPFAFDPSENLGGPVTLTDDDAAGPASRTFSGLLPGTYSVSETDLPAGWQLTGLQCTGGGANTTVAGSTATIGLDAGEAVVCTFENTREGSITIEKDAVPDSGQPFAFDAAGAFGAEPSFTL